MQPKPLIRPGKLEKYLDIEVQITTLSPDLQHAIGKCVEVISFGADPHKLSMWPDSKGRVLTVMQS